MRARRLIALLGGIVACTSAASGVGDHGGDADAGDDAAAASRDAGAEAESDADAMPYSCRLGAPGAALPAVPLVPAVASGTRIRPRYIELEDGTRYLYEIYDQGLDTLCTITIASDGKRRCVPVMAKKRAGFADAACTASIAAAWASCPPVRFIEEGGKYFEGTPTTSSFSNASGSCAAATQPLVDQLFAFGASVAATAFVEFTEQRQKVTNELDAVMQVGSDGSRIWLNDLYDSEHDVAVAPVKDAVIPHVGPILSKTSARCCGDPATFTCSTVSRWPIDCPAFAVPSSARLVRTSGDTPPYWSAWVPGAPLPAALNCAVFGSQQGGQPGQPPNYTCTTVRQTMPGWSEAILIPTECWAKIDYRPSTTGRVRPHHPSMPLVIGGILVTPLDTKTAPKTLFVPFFTDTVTGKQCAMIRMTDGKVHCAPFRSVETDMVFTDPSCTTLLPTLAVDDKPYAILENRQLGCPQTGAVRVYDSAAATQVVSTYHLERSGACVAGPGGPIARATRVELPPETFPEIKVVIP